MSRFARHKVYLDAQGMKQRSLALSVLITQDTAELNRSPHAELMLISFFCCFSRIPGGGGSQWPFFVCFSFHFSSVFAVKIFELAVKTAGKTN